MIERMFDTVALVDDSMGWVPASLERVPPGAVLAAMLDDIDLDACSGFDRIRVLRAHERMRAHYTARSLHTVNAVMDSLDESDLVEDCVEDATSAEVAAALRLTRRCADLTVEFAVELKRRLPAVWRALCNGEIDERRARILVSDTIHLPVSVACDLVDGLLGEVLLLTTGQLKARIRKLAIQQDPDDAKRRYDRSVEDRRVALEPDPDGVAHLHVLNVSPDRLQAALSRINTVALGLRRNGDARSMDQLRADVVLDLLEGHGDSVGRGVVTITASLESLTRLAEHPGDLGGYGPVVADIARQAVRRQHDTKWRWMLVDPDTGRPIDGGITKRRPTAAQQRKVELLFPTCVHPGCRMPSVDCDIDHITPWTQTGVTNTDELAPLCRYHHRIRHQAGWSYTHQPDGGHTFTTPLQHTYTTTGPDP